jgi:class 3 adenylate cyclase
VPVCPVCAQENPEGARFCLACGSALTPGAGAPRRDERRIVTIIFVDLVGFTARAERLDPEEVRAILTPYHERVRREIQSFGGVVEKFIGDAVMGVFGAPIAYGDDAERAVRAALVVRDAVGEIAHGDLSIRIAVNTGEAVVSLGASPALGESMVAGDVVNTASRLQGAAPVNGVVVGEETFRATRGVVDYQEAEPIVAKGKGAPVRAWVALRALAPAGERPAGDSLLVGRTRELDLLHALWERVMEDRAPHLVTIIGAAGVGKTTLAANFRRAVAADGAITAVGRCLPYRESSAYGAFATQVMHLCDVFESDAADIVLRKLQDRAAAALGTDAAEVARHLALLVGIDAGGEAAEREDLFRSTRRLLHAVASDRPSLLVFEDLHWADVSLLDLVEELAGHLRDVPLLVVALARPELLDGRPGWASGVFGHTTLSLEPLKPAEAHELAVRRLGEAARADEVTRLAEGNPLFIEQLAATMGEQAHGALPTTIRGILAARLDALPAAERSLLLDAAVAGKVFWPGALRAMTPALPDVAPLLDSLERRDLIRRESASMIEGEEQFSFKHVLIRDVAYDLLPRAERARRHGDVARFFEGATGVSAQARGALARHWRDAGENDRAVEQLVLAAEQAERGWAKDRAASLYREALELVPADDTERRSMLRRKLAVASQAVFHLGDVRRPGSQPA